MLVKKELEQMSQEAFIRVETLPKSGQVVNINCYQSGKIQARFFSDGQNYIFYSCLEDKWGLKNHFAAPSSYDLPRELDENKKLIRLVREILFPETEPEDRRVSYACGVVELAEAFIAKHNRETYSKRLEQRERLQEQHFGMFPALPDDFADWCNQRLFGDAQYLFFSSKDKKGKRVITCSSCGAIYATDESIKHKQASVCQKCGHSALYIAERYVSSKEDKREACVCSKNGDAYLFETFKVYRTYDKRLHPKYAPDSIEMILYWPDKKKGKIYKYSYTHIMYYGYDWHRRIDEMPRLKAMVYDRNLRDILPGRYGKQLENVLKNYQFRLCVPQLVLNLELIPQTEYLLKTGMIQLAASADGLTFQSGKGFSGAMGIDNAYREIYKKLDITPEEHFFIKHYDAFIKSETLQQMRSLEIAGSYTLLSLKRDYGIAVEKALRYVCKLDEKHHTRYYLERWYDYLGLAKALNLDLNNDTILYPKDPLQEHNRLVELQRQIREEAVKEQREKEAALFAEKSDFYVDMARKCQTEKYMIKIARTHNDLIREGIELHHCVGGEHYWNKHWQGKSLICFIRKRGEENTPYFTCEIGLEGASGYYIAQLYGMKDCKPNQEIRAFAERYLRMIKPVKKKVI